MKYKQGFSLLEALVALLLIALAGGAVLTAINNDLFLANKLIKNAQLMTHKTLMLEFSNVINPMQQPQGKIELGGNQEISWKGEPINKITKGKGRTGVDGDYNLALYKLTLILKSNAQGEVLHKESFSVLGYKSTK